jgi:hypothetical protein
MTNNREALKNGATAFRNLRDLTEKRRQELIDQATDDPTVDYQDYFPDGTLGMVMLQWLAESACAFLTAKGVIEKVEGQ